MFTPPLWRHPTAKVVTRNFSSGLKGKGRQHWRTSVMRDEPPAIMKMNQSSSFGGDFAVTNCRPRRALSAMLFTRNYV
jgi:hypothetical protein